MGINDPRSPRLFSFQNVFTYFSFKLQAWVAELQITYYSLLLYTRHEAENGTES